MAAGDEHGDALDPGAERRLPHARSHDCARAARFRVHRCQDVQVTTSGAEDEQLTTGPRQRTRARVRRRASPSPRPSPAGQTSRRRRSLALACIACLRNRHSSVVGASGRFHVSGLWATTRCNTMGRCARGGLHVRCRLRYVAMAGYTVNCVSCGARDASAKSLKWSVRNGRVHYHDSEHHYCVTV